MRMTARATRWLRVALLLALVVLSGAIVYTFRRRHATPARLPEIARRVPAERPHGERIEYFRYSGDKKTVRILAQSKEGKEGEEVVLRGVLAEIPFVARGQAGSMSILADKCVWNERVQSARFAGSVKATTNDGLEFTGQSLLYGGDTGIARSDEKVSYKRKDVSGESVCLVYDSRQRTVEFVSNVIFRIADEKTGTTMIHGAHALMEREAGRMDFSGGVEVSKGQDVLRAAQLEVEFSPDDDSLRRAVATDDVEMRTAGEVPGITGFPGGRSARLLRCRKLDIFFTATRGLQDATAGPDADLTIYPGPKDAPESRRLQARFLVFRFNAEGQLEEVQGQKDGHMSTEPQGGGGAARNLTCQNFVAHMDPATGEAREIEFTRDVDFTQGGRRAVSASAWYVGEKKQFILKGDPQLWDSEKGWHLAAQAIDISDNGDIAARHKIRNTLRQVGNGAFLGAADTVASCDFFGYTAQTHVASYRQAAVLRSGKDEIRAAEIRLRDEGEGHRVLDASGGVASILQPRGEPGGKTQAKVEGRAKEMTYDEAGRQVGYRGDVVIHQGDLVVKTPAEANITLAAAGVAVERLTAGEPVELTQAARVLNGGRVKYTPADDTVTMVGEKVVLRDTGQEVQGRSLTFHLGDDRIIVDGREQSRTETIFRKESPKP